MLTGWPVRRRLCRGFALGGLHGGVPRKPREGIVRVYLYTRYADSPCVSLDLRSAEPRFPSCKPAPTESGPNMGQQCGLSTRSIFLFFPLRPRKSFASKFSQRAFRASTRNTVKILTRWIIDFMMVFQRSNFIFDVLSSTHKNVEY